MVAVCQKPCRAMVPSYFSFNTPKIISGTFPLDEFWDISEREEADMVNLLALSFLLLCLISKLAIKWILRDHIAAISAVLSQTTTAAENNKTLTMKKAGMVALFLFAMFYFASPVTLSIIQMPVVWQLVPWPDEMETRIPWRSGSITRIFWLWKCAP